MSLPSVESKLNKKKSRRKQKNNARSVEGFSTENGE